jgi:hypothetical protein
MYIYLDDSGDAGLKFDKGSSRYIVMAACVFETKEQVKTAWRQIESCRCVGFDGVKFTKYSREFKYNRTNSSLKKTFFECMDLVEYGVHVIILDKTQLYSEYLKENPNNLKAYLIRMLLTHSKGYLRDAVLVVDGKDNRSFGGSDQDYFMHMVNGECPGTLRSVEFVDSKKSPLVQLADMTAGAIHAMFEKGSPSSYAHVDIFRHKTWGEKGHWWFFQSGQR